VPDFDPLDVACPTCEQPPGSSCVSFVHPGEPRLPHADRISAARRAAAGEPPPG